MSSKLTFLVLLVVAFSVAVPGAYSCVTFEALYADVPRSPTTIVGTLFDNIGEVCSYFGPLGGDGLYDFGCIAGFSASLTPSTGFVQYATPAGSFPFVAPYVDNIGWQTCQFGCSC
ncbi:unnamed protein product [Calypogeia fissa]